MTDRLGLEKQNPVVSGGSPRLTDVRFQALVDVPSELEWFANISNKSARRPYENTLQDFIGFIGISKPGKFRGGDLLARHRLARRPGRQTLERDDGAPPPGRPLLALRAPV